MSTFRKSLFAALAAVAALTATATAHPPTVPGGHPPTHQPQARYFYVYARTDPDAPWVYIGYTPDVNIAIRYVQYYQSYGYEAFYR